MKLYTFGSKQSIYETLAYECAQRFKAYGIEVEPIIYEALPIRPGPEDARDAHKWLKTWMTNILKRVTLLEELSAALSPEESIGLLDSDLFPLRQPDLTVPEGYECALTLRPDDPETWHKACAGVVLFSPSGRKILAKWARLCWLDEDWNQRCREQVYLWKAIQGRKVFNLGEKYNSGRWVESPSGRKWLPEDDAVLFHDVTQKERER